MIEDENKIGKTITIDELKDSIDGMHQRLEELKETNGLEVRKTTQKFQAQYKETEKQVDTKLKDAIAAMKLQHRETRRRLERLEKKTSSGYLK